MSAGAKTVAARLVEIVEERYELGRSESGECYALGPESHIVRMLRGGASSLRAELSEAYHTETGRPANAGALSDALGVVEGRAHRQAPTALHLRSAVTDGQVVVDLGWEDGQVAIITADGWWLSTDSPCLFRRTRLTSAMSVAPGGGDLDELADHIHLDAPDWPLVVAWLVAVLLADRPAPGILLVGEQGTAKTTSARHLVQIVDPSPAPLRAMPADARDWAVAAWSSRVIGIDNLSRIPVWLADALCRVVTGEGYVHRQLYTDDEVVVMAMQRAVICTAIDAGGLRGDLADRLIGIQLRRISTAERQQDAVVERAFGEARGRITAGLFDVTARVLATLGTITVDELPRMADYGMILAAVDAVCGTDGLGRYAASAERLAVEVVEGDVVARAIVALIDVEGRWRGTYGQLMDAATPERRPKFWPETARAMAARVRRVAPSLRQVGVVVDDVGHSRHGNVVEISQHNGTAVPRAAELPF